MELSPSDFAYIDRLRESAAMPVFDRAFGQPEDQGLPADLLAMLVELDRSKR